MIHVKEKNLRRKGKIGGYNFIHRESLTEKMNFCQDLNVRKQLYKYLGEKSSKKREEEGQRED